jgi:ABC-type branched-subunit amino acid transport system ATPase component
MSGISLTITPEIVGLGVISGLTPADRGDIVLGGANITHLAAHERSRLGIVRSFQDAALFETLTVLETVRLAFERRVPTPYGSLLGIDRGSRLKEQKARELVSLMGLEPVRDRRIRELSTGTRRITDLACILALQPAVLLLDEPSSGIAQRESEALGELLVAVRRSLDCAMVVIEHDIPLLMGLADRVMAMDTGRVIASGTPDEVRHHPDVVTSYLGGSLVAIERSGPVAAVRT